MNDLTSLQGLNVVEIGDGWTTALCGKLLADLGAGVTRVEAPWGDKLNEFGRSRGERNFVNAMVNGAKRVLAADDDEVDLAEILASADVVVVEDETVRRLELELASLDDSTVVCRFSPYGLASGVAGRAYSDLTLQAVSGVMATTGLPGGRPLRAGTELSSAVGSLYGAIGTIAALIERERSTKGQIVDVSLYECLVSTLTNFASRVLGGHDPLGRLGNQGPNSAPWELFESGDNEYVFIIAGSDPTYERLIEAMGAPELLTDSRFETPHLRRDHAEEITALVADWVKTLSRKEIVSILRESGVPVSPVSRVAEVLEDEHFASRGLLTTVEDEQGTQWPTAGQPFGFGQGTGTHVKPSAATSDREGTPAGDGPLAGVRVVDFGTLTAGPFAARLLGNMGADVLKIEPLQGETGRHSLPILDGQSVYFHITNNGKRSFSVSLREPDDVALVERVIRQADVLIENQAPGALTKRGLGPDEMLEAAPHLVYTSVSGYGHEGMLGGHRAYDTVIQAGAGLMSTTGEEGGLPLKTGISSADVLGSLAATTASLAALFGRITGRHGGVRLDTALYDILAWSTQMAWVTEFSELGGATRYGNGHWLYAPHETFEAADGGWVAISCEREEHWQALAQILADELGELPPDLSSWDRQRRWEERHELNRLLAEFVGSREAVAVVDRLQRGSVPAEPVVEVKDVFGSRQELVSTTAEVDLYTGARLHVTEIPIRLGRTKVGVRTGGPDLGAEDQVVRSDPDTAWTKVFGSTE